MRILLTGAHGYIGSQLLPVLLGAGHEVIALVRRAPPDAFPGPVSVCVADLLNPQSLESLPKDIDVAYYLVHSMSQQSSRFFELEASCAHTFVQALEKTSCQQIIYLSGLSRDPSLSEHMRSRRNVESILCTSTIPTTVLRSGIVIGKDSLSFAIIRDLVEKLPVMICPRWVHSKCQPIALCDALLYLTQVLLNPACYNRMFEIGGPDVLSYKEMLERYAAFRGLRRWIFTIPMLTPGLSSLWLALITKTPQPLARALVESLRTDAIVLDHSVDTVLSHACLGYEEALGMCT